MRNLAGYFGLYFLSGQLDKHIKVEVIEQVNILNAALCVNAMLSVQIILNYFTRKEIQKKMKKDEEN